MANAKHTPGPWHCEANGGDDTDERELLVGCDDQYGDFTIVADCRSKWLPDEVGGEEEANARLIAAAPNLLTALVTAEEILRLNGFDDHAATARAVIREATPAN